MNTTIKPTIALILLNLAAAAFLFSVSCNNPQKSASASMGENAKPDSAKTTNATDAKFLSTVSQINMEEIKLGELAQQNSSMPEVKQLGEMMQDDHQKAQDELTELARKKSITISVTPDDNAQADYKKLSSLSGNEFDKQYCDMMVNGHRDALAMFRKESTDGSDPDIRQWVLTVIPTLQKHLDHATDCQLKCNKPM